jgi:hypothetical protein
MLNQVNGLPAHILLVHAVIVLVPLAAAMLVASAVWPAARRRLGLATPVAAVVTFLSIPPATQAGEWLQARVPDNPLVRSHAEMGHAIIPFSALMVALAALVWWRGRQADADPRPAGPGAALATELRRPTDRWTVLLGVVSVLVAVAAVATIVRIGDSGAKASWQNKVSTVPHVVPGEDG